jgi:Raf kinase inhibitor-like YbhB/YbcL family protein
MLEKLPPSVGRALRRVRPGVERTVALRKGVVTGSPSLVIESDFEDGAAIAKRYTADAEGISPPLRWSAVPPRTRTLALIVEDADSPTPLPLVHAILARIPARVAAIDEDAIGDRDGAAVVGKNSYLHPGWLAPDPPPGHGPHRYVFQLFALDYDPDLGAMPGRGALVRAISSHVLAYGLLIGTYSR